LTHELIQDLTYVFDFMALKTVGTSSGERRNISAIMDLIEEILSKKLEDGGDSNDADVAVLVQKLKKMGV
jgi:hypothetical protein